ncbi:MAG TPA: hypothetical protein VFT18_05475 [Gaiellaceae bacterium]|nr:hypothetical protein [Gaiellaceae bacterium]
MPRFLVLVAAAVLASAGAASPATLGEQRVLIMLTTWGPEPYAPDQIRGQLDEAAAYMRSTSYGKTWLTGEVTPWLHALPSKPGCDTGSIALAAQSAARAAGYDLARYTTLGIAMPHLDACAWGGAYFAPGIWLNGRWDRQVIAHELGHTYGISEEGSAWVCDPTCQAEPYRDPFSVMGHGLSDYGAWEKHMFGWVDRVAAPAARVSLGAIDRTGTSAQALRVVVAGDEYWFEYRPPVPVWPYAPDAAPGVAIHAGSNGLGEPGRFPGRNLLLHDPVRRGRPSVQAGETFAVRGAFAVRVDSAGSDTAELAFRWTDRTRPARPRIVGARVRGARLFVRWLRGSEHGSGIAAHDVYVDGRRAGRVASSRILGSLAIANDDAFAIRVRPGRHTVAVVAVDRAGNRSRPARRVAKRT